MDGNTCATPVGDVGNGGGYACTGARGKWKLLVFSAPFCCESETALNKKVYFLKGYLVYDSIYITLFKWQNTKMRNRLVVV